MMPEGGVVLPGQGAKLGRVVRAHDEQELPRLPIAGGDGHTRGLVVLIIVIQNLTLELSGRSGFVEHPDPISFYTNFSSNIFGT